MCGTLEFFIEFKMLIINNNKSIQQAVKSPQNEPVLKAKVPTKSYQQTFRMSKSDYDFIKGLIVYQRMNGKPTFTRGDAIALWVEWIQEKCPTVKPYTEDL